MDQAAVHSSIAVREMYFNVASKAERGSWKLSAVNQTVSAMLGLGRV
jgi:hypothetical protein